MYNIKYSKQAQIDLEDAISHIAKESITTYVDSFDKKVSQ